MRKAIQGKVKGLVPNQLKRPVITMAEEKTEEETQDEETPAEETSDDEESE